MRGDRFNKMSLDLQSAKNQKPEFLHQIYQQAKLMEISLSENEIQSKQDYEISRLDYKLWRMIESDRKKSSMMKEIKKARGIKDY